MYECIDLVCYNTFKRLLSSFRYEDMTIVLRTISFSFVAQKKLITNRIFLVLKNAFKNKSTQITFYRPSSRRYSLNMNQNHGFVAGFMTTIKIPFHGTESFWWHSNEAKAYRNFENLMAWSAATSRFVRTYQY